jgi:hypothetical protein
LNGMKMGPQHEPPFRRLRAFAFDPILSRRIETYDINEVTIQLPWEDNLKLGPVDDYLEVVDRDPASQVFYAPVDLNDARLLAQDGLPPSEGNPQFHQQMVYAVARTTIGYFEQALGRRALWSPRLGEPKKPEAEADRISDAHYDEKKAELQKDVEFVERLRIYPHALREANAYYSPVKKALLLGYFPASITDPGENLPGGMVFTCLSHDIVAHETTHALIDGLHRRFIEPTNVDVWALHEALADIVALFQHFSYPHVLQNQIARTHGELERQNLLGELAFQFGQAIGQYGALRSAIGSIDPETKKWIPEEPDPEKIHRITEPHERGAILVAAVFESFLTIYKWRIADLLRIATGGTGVLPAGELNPDLVGRLAEEAAKRARHILQMCIRALDYCPPVDVDFGDYLRALITADADLVTDDKHSYRLAVIEAFRRRGIYPHDVRNLSEESLVWRAPNYEEQQEFLKVFAPKSDPERLRVLVPDWGLTTNRGKMYDQARIGQATLHQWFTDPSALDAAKAAHIVLDKNGPKGFYRDKNGVPKLEIHSVRPARRVGPDGQTVTELVVEMTQRRRGYYDSKIQNDVDAGKIKLGQKESEPDFIFRGGCTLLIDPDTSTVRYCIYKNILNNDRLDRTRKFLTGDVSPSLRVTYYGDPRRAYFESICGPEKERKEHAIEPFALLHRSSPGLENGWRKKEQKEREV